MKCDLLIKNGTVIDPAGKQDEMANVYVKDGKIVEGAGVDSVEATFDAAGMYVFPGLIDYHAHVFSGATEIGVPADLSFIPQGVTAVCDAGSAGTANFDCFVEKVAHGSRMRVKAFLNVCPAGLATGKYHENIDPKHWDRGRIREIFERYPDIAVGLKIRISKDIVANLGLRPLEEAVKLAAEVKVPLAVHSTNPPEVMEKVAGLLRAGDILVHCFHGTGHTILDDRGKVSQALWDARRRGVVMDAANGRNHWTFAVAEAAISQGFFPDIISTDITMKTLYKDPVFGLPYIMSKYLALGMPLREVVARCTAAPAKLLGLGDRIGSLRTGAAGDISVFRLSDKTVTFSDTIGQTKTGRQVLLPQLTILRGKVLYRSLTD